MARLQALKPRSPCRLSALPVCRGSTCRLVRFKEVQRRASSRHNLQPPGWPAALCCWLDPLHPATRLHAAAARKLDGVNGSPALTSGWQTRRTVRGGRFCAHLHSNKMPAGQHHCEKGRGAGAASEHSSLLATAVCRTLYPSLGLVGLKIRERISCFLGKCHIRAQVLLLNHMHYKHSKPGSTRFAI